VLNYSIIQLALHVLLSELWKSEEKIDQERKEGARKERGFHNWLKRPFLRELNRKDRKAAREFNNKFSELKNIRVKSDYKNVAIHKNEAEKAFSLSQDINAILSEKFRV